MGVGQLIGPPKSMAMRLVTWQCGPHREVGEIFLLPLANGVGQIFTTVELEAVIDWLAPSPPSDFPLNKTDRKIYSDIFHQSILRTKKKKKKKKDLKTFFFFFFSFSPHQMRFRAFSNFFFFIIIIIGT